ncbi:hypothetical protein DY000_02006265 [Brassica cretica]|uniref:Uncharacterized protein n=1 Tax=Brassica cretica TaxID=69181 RepID=A0ABQ7C677_BRACR|nr:hypothetical protein DY000_02006265 [Brassica cretica]
MSEKKKSPSSLLSLPISSIGLNSPFRWRLRLRKNLVRFQRIKGWRKQSKLGESEQGCGEHMIRGVGEDIAMASKMEKKIWTKLKSQSERRRR